MRVGNESQSRRLRNLPVLVGESNPYFDPSLGGRADDAALYPTPDGSSGDRLCALLGLSRYEYLRRFERSNLCARKWCLPDARTRAAELAWALHRGEVPALVLLGARVCHAFGVSYRPMEPVCEFIPHVLGVVYVIPHPSGRSRRWGEPDDVGPALRRYLAPLLTREEVAT